MIRSAEFITRNKYWYSHAKICKQCRPLARRLKLEDGLVVIGLQLAATASQAAPSAPRALPEQEDHEGPKRPVAAWKAAQKCKASQFDESGGDQIEKERKTKVYGFLSCACSPLLMCDVYYRELSSTTPDSAPLPVLGLL